MITALEKFYQSVLPKKEGFGEDKSTFMNLLPTILALVTIQLLVLVLGKYLWNTYLVEYVTFVKPVSSVLDLFAIMILLNVMRLV